MVLQICPHSTTTAQKSHLVVLADGGGPTQGLTFDVRDDPELDNIFNKNKNIDKLALLD